MGKKLILVRHGKSSWKEHLPDKKRPLKKRGYRDAEIISTAFRPYLFSGGELELITSPAVRAFETAHYFKKALKITDKNFTIDEKLYTFDASKLLQVIRNQNDAIESLMFFGHNPAMTTVVNQLGNKTIDNLPTTGLVVIDFETKKWETIADGKTILMLFPKMFK